MEGPVEHLLSLSQAARMVGVRRRTLQHYHDVTDELKERLYMMQEQCERNQSALLGALITWVARKTQGRD